MVNFLVDLSLQFLLIQHWEWGLCNLQCFLLDQLSQHLWWWAQIMWRGYLQWPCYQIVRRNISTHYLLSLDLCTKHKQSSKTIDYVTPYCLLVNKILQLMFHLLHSFTVNTADLSKCNILWAGKAYWQTHVYILILFLYPLCHSTSDTDTARSYLPGRSVRPKILDRIALLASWNFPTNHNIMHHT